MSSELLILLQLNLVWWYNIVSWIVSWKEWIALLWSRSSSQKRFRIPVNFHLDDISSTAEPFVTKLGIVMHHHGPECHARRLVCCLPSSGSQWRCIQSDMTFSIISVELVIFLKPKFTGWYITTSWSVLWKNQIVVFKVKITVQVQNFIVSLCILCLLHYWSLCNRN